MKIARQPDKGNKKKKRAPFMKRGRKFLAHHRATYIIYIQRALLARAKNDIHGEGAMHQRREIKLKVAPRGMRSNKKEGHEVQRGAAPASVCKYK